MLGVDDDPVEAERHGHFGDGWGVERHPKPECCTVGGERASKCPAGGCLHEEVAIQAIGKERVPRLSLGLYPKRWPLTSTGPMNSDAQPNDRESTGNGGIVYGKVSTWTAILPSRSVVAPISGHHPVSRRPRRFWPSTWLISIPTTLKRCDIRPRASFPIGRDR